MSSITCLAQPAQRMADLYFARQYEPAIALGKKNIASGIEMATSYQLIGRSFADMNQYDSAVGYLQQSVALDQDQTWISAWSHGYLGACYLKLGNEEDGIAELKKCISLNKTQNSTEYAQALLFREVNYPKLPEKLDLFQKETEHIIYYFDDTSSLEQTINNYISRHDAMYEELEKLFHAKVPGKIKFFVFTRKKRAEKELGRRLGFTLVDKAMCFSMYNQTVGHEMCHVMSYWSFGKPPIAATRFVSEGLSVCFDGDKSDIFERAKSAIAKNEVKGSSVVAIWQNAKRLNDVWLYPVAGAFMRYLYTTLPKSDFESIVKDQTLANLQSIWGDDFDNKIAEFDTLVGLK